MAISFLLRTFHFSAGSRFSHDDVRHVSIGANSLMRRRRFCNNVDAKELEMFLNTVKMAEKEGEGVEERF